MRPSGREPGQLRPIRFVTDYTRHAEGSVLAEFGDTRVLCTASIEPRVPAWMRNSGKGWVTGEYGMLPRSTHTRSGREAARGKQGGRTLEISRLIGRSLRAITNMDALGDMVSGVVEGGLVLQRALREHRNASEQIMLFRTYLKLLFAPRWWLRSSHSSPGTTSFSHLITRFSSTTPKTGFPS